MPTEPTPQPACFIKLAERRPEFGQTVTVFYPQSDGWMSRRLQFVKPYAGNRREWEFRDMQGYSYDLKADEILWIADPPWPDH